MWFGKKNRKEEEERYQDRLPPGQSLTLKWPVLHVGSVPHYRDLSLWDFYIRGRVEKPVRFTWEEFSSLPMKSQVNDMHCVTQWSKFDNTFEGIPVAEVMKHVNLLPDATHVMVHADPGYTTNIPLEDFLDDDVMFPLKYEGQPLTPDHGYPVRLLVPKLYLWKSAKWVRGLEFLAGDKPGFWERYGYHNHGDPWQEERFGGFVVDTMQNVRSKR
ncbi:MAG: sulfite oxidase-like oxidoreductase [Anaerolineae bacterium]|nr:sulfite oxidase-like oxidoreductase [Anaerolineae bacterium]